MQLKKDEKWGLGLILAVLVFLVFTPHIVNPFPNHIDEWRHITEAIKLRQGEFSGGLNSIEIGFHIILVFISLFFDLLIVYKFLPAIWAALGGLILFMIVRTKTKNLKSCFIIAILSVMFFASIKSNVNITGLWFFTPLTFAIPFIYLYIYLFSEGLQKQNKKYILFSLIIMIFLLPTHAVSVLFAIPILFIYSLFHLDYLKKEYRFFLIFLIIPLIGILFYTFLFNLSLLEAIKQLLIQIQFKKGFGVLELNNSFSELYSPVGYFLAAIGIYYMISSKYKFKKYLVYTLWPIITLIYIIIFKLTDISFLSPYQRNLYYFAISLPFLSALGLYYLTIIIKKSVKKLGYKYDKQNLVKIITAILMVLVFLLTFQSYYQIPDNIKLYKAIDQNDYETLKFLETLPKSQSSKVMAPISISTAIFPVSLHEPVGTIFFYGLKKDVDNFFKSNNCTEQNELIQKNNVNYVLSKQEINCNWSIIYNKNENIIYKIT
jgi:hypothetical protein